MLVSLKALDLLSFYYFNEQLEQLKLQNFFAVAMTSKKLTFSEGCRSTIKSNGKDETGDGGGLFVTLKSLK